MDVRRIFAKLLVTMGTVGWAVVSFLVLLAVFLFLTLDESVFFISDYLLDISESIGDFFTILLILMLNLATGILGILYILDHKIRKNRIRFLYYLLIVATALIDIGVLQLVFMFTRSLS